MFFVAAHCQLTLYEYVPQYLGALYVGRLRCHVVLIVEELFYDLSCTKRKRKYAFSLFLRGSNLFLSFEPVREPS